MTNYDLTLAFTQNAAFYLVKQALEVVSDKPYREARNIFKSYVESKLDDSTLFSNVVNDTQIETELPDYIPAWMIVSSMYEPDLVRHIAPISKNDVPPRFSYNTIDATVCTLSNLTGIPTESFTVDFSLYGEMTEFIPKLNRHAIYQIICVKQTIMMEFLNANDLEKYFCKDLKKRSVELLTL